MIYYVAYRLKRKNARRRIHSKFICPNADAAKRDLKILVEHDANADKKQFELLTGDWKHICFYDDLKGNEEG